MVVTLIAIRMGLLLLMLGIGVWATATAAWWCAPIFGALVAFHSWMLRRIIRVYRQRAAERWERYP